MAFITVASGNGTLQLPEYVTVKTGKYSDIEDNVEILTLKGNTEGDPVFSSWVPMHGVKIFYRLHDSNRWATIHDNNKVTFQSTGAWKVQVEKPPGV